MTRAPSQGDVVRRRAETLQEVTTVSLEASHCRRASGSSRKDRQDFKGDQDMKKQARRSAKIFDRAIALGVSNINTKF